MWSGLQGWFGGTRPIDWLMLVIEFLVLGLIAAELIHQLYRHFRVARITKRLNRYASQGQAFQWSVPKDLNTDITPWDKNVKMWIQEVEIFLETKCSEQAKARFIHFKVRSTPTLRIPDALHATFLELESRLENLNAIIEKPEVYM